MSFKNIYIIVEKCKRYSVSELIRKERLELIRDNSLTNDRQARMHSHKGITVIFLQEGLTDQQEKLLLLHELGHFYLDSGCPFKNKRTEENNANLFMCLRLINNDIWNCNYFSNYLIDLGVSKKVARGFDDAVWQYKQQVKYKLAY